MTAKDFQRIFMLKIGQLANITIVESEDIEYYVNRVTVDYIDEQYHLLRDNIRNQQFGSSDVQKATENLQKLIKTVDSSDTEYPDHEVVDNFAENIIGMELPDDYMYYLAGRVKFSETQADITGSSFLNFRIIDPNQLNAYLKSKYNSPIFREAAAVIKSTMLEVALPSDSEVSDISSVVLTYVKEPVKLSISDETVPDLPLNSHEMLVDMAVQKYLQDRQFHSIDPRNIQQSVQQQQQQQQQEDRRENE